MKKLQLFGICLLILITGINNAVAQQQGGSSNYFDLIEQQDTYYDSLLNVLGPDSMQGTGYKQYIRWRAFVSMRLDDDGTLDNYMNAVNGYYNGAQGTTGYNWSYFGPKGLTENIDWSFGKGWIYSIHVNEDNHNVIHAGAHNSGLYKTINGGKSWRCITDNMPEITGVKGLAIPDDDTATIYIATVANVGSYFNGLFKTSNSGQTWIKLDLLYNGNDLYPDNNWRKYPKKIIIHPANSNIIFFLANHYIAKSTDAGQNWTVNHFSDFEYPGEEFEDIIFDSDDPDIMYVSGHVVLKSVDGGDTWTEDITLDITNNPANLKICTMYSSDNYPGKIWFLATFRQNSYPKVVRYDSDNNEYETLFNVISNNHDAFNPGYLRSNIVVSGTDESLIYIGGIEHGVRNEDIGDEFGILNPFQRIDTYYWHSGLQRKSIIDQNKYVHDDIRDLEIFSSEEADTIYIANDGGIRKAWTVGDTSITVNGYYLGIWKLYDNIDLRDWKPGTYIISLVSNGKTVQSEKFTKF